MLYLSYQKAEQAMCGEPAGTKPQMLFLLSPNEAESKGED